MTIVPFRDLNGRFNLKDSDRVLDIGGSGGQVEEVQIDTLIDAVHPEYFRKMYTHILPPERRPAFDVNARHFIQLDLCRDCFPVPDKAFDFCIFTHTLEDLYDPRLALAEIGRVAKRGLIVTPSRGAEMVFTPFDITDWLTGGARVPGHAHHHWFVEVLAGKLTITPKHYPLLYSPEFHVVGWSGPAECEYYWEGQPNVTFWESLDFRELLSDYRRFLAANGQRLRTGRVLFWVDRPQTMLRAYWRRARRVGNAYKLG